MGMIDTTYLTAGVMSGHIVGRASDILLDGAEVRALGSGMDFRDTRYRREVFIRFYLFHLMLRAHPGCVYYVLPELTKGLDYQTKLWVAFINGCTQNPVTTELIRRRFPELPSTPYQVKCLTDWFNEEWARLPFDTDRRYQKKEFPEAVRQYSEWVQAAGGGVQSNAFASVSVSRNPQEHFDDLWRFITGPKPGFWGFGRLGAWSYMEYLFIMGMPLEPSSMMLGDKSGSKSHRNGLAKVLGRDDLDWKKGSPFQGDYSKEVLAWLEREADALLEETQQAAIRWNSGSNFPKVPTEHISRFTLESALCTYKGWYRPNRRYPNVYNDMLRDRIEHVQRLNPTEDLGQFWVMRREQQPDWALVELDPTDPGLARPKQNHFRETGQIPMMGNAWNVFKHDETWRNA